MKKGDIIEIRTIDRRGMISFAHKKIKDARAAKKLLRENGYQQMPAEPHAWFRSHQYEPR
jgi:hypothetical protein